MTAQELANVNDFLKPLDSYGYKKIQCEEVLEEYANTHTNTEVIALRLADVIGPFDDSARLWKYTTWMQALHGVELKYFDDALTGHNMKSIPRESFPGQIGYEEKDLH